MHTIKRAIIMAAGIGNRLRPITTSTLKPLVMINGVRIIDTIINGLKRNNINEIYIVVGYLKEQFNYLEKANPGLRLIENKYYDTCNNISSLYFARRYLEDVIILDGDQIIYNDAILNPNFELSGYNCIWTDQDTEEWLLTVENGIIKACDRNGGKNGYRLYSISRWTASDGDRLKYHLELEFEKKQNRQIYWDDVAMFCYPEEYELGIMEMKEGDVVEIDNLLDLAMLDNKYNKYIKEV